MKITVTFIGFGNLGRTLSTLLMAHESIAFHFNIMEVSKKLSGTLLDFQHALTLYPQHTWSFNDQEAMNNSDFIFHSAGAIVAPGNTRRDASETSIRITESALLSYNPQKQAFFIVLANPVDIISYVSYKLTKLPASHVIGTGTFLDTLRMNLALKAYLPELRKIESVLLGEHGSSVFMSHQLSKAGDKHIHKLLKEEELDNCLEEVKHAANLIKQTQGATIYGVSHIAYQLFLALLKDEVSLLPLSTMLPESYLQDNTLHPIYLSTLCEVSKNGVFPSSNYHPDPIELAKFHYTVQELSAYIPAKYFGDF